MRCLQLVMWRGAMALSLVVGVGSGHGLYAPPACSVQSEAGCFEDANALRGSIEVKCIDASGSRVRVMLGYG